MVRLLGRHNMRKKGSGGNAGDRPLQTPTAGDPVGGNSNPNLQLEDVPVESTSRTGSSQGNPSSMADTEKTKEIFGKVDKASKTMEQNIQAATQRGESLSELQDKTQAVAESSKQFSKNARTVKKNLWWKNMKFTMIIVLIVLCVVGGIVALVVFQNK